MPQSFSRHLLSGQTNLPQQITTSSVASYVTVHTAPATAGTIDEVYMWIKETFPASKTITVRLSHSGNTQEMFSGTAASVTQVLNGTVIGPGVVVEVYVSGTPYTPPTGAADTYYQTNSAAATITLHYADGTQYGTLPFSKGAATGVIIDAARGFLYWADSGLNFKATDLNHGETYSATGGTITSGATQGWFYDSVNMRVMVDKYFINVTTPSAPVVSAITTHYATVSQSQYDHINNVYFLRTTNGSSTSIRTYKTTSLTEISELTVTNGWVDCVWPDNKYMVRVGGGPQQYMIYAVYNSAGVWLSAEVSWTSDGNLQYIGEVVYEKATGVLWCAGYSGTNDNLVKKTTTSSTTYALIPAGQYFSPKVTYDRAYCVNGYAVFTYNSTRWAFSTTGTPALYTGIQKEGGGQSWAYGQFAYKQVAGGNHIFMGVYTGSGGGYIGSIIDDASWAASYDSVLNTGTSYIVRMEQAWATDHLFVLTSTVDRLRSYSISSTGVLAQVSDITMAYSNCYDLCSNAASTKIYTLENGGTRVVRRSVSSGTITSTPDWTSSAIGEAHHDMYLDAAGGKIYTVVAGGTQIRSFTESTGVASTSYTLPYTSASGSRSVWSNGNLFGRQMVVVNGYLYVPVYIGASSYGITGINLSDGTMTTTHVYTLGGNSYNCLNPSFGLVYGVPFTYADGAVVLLANSPLQGIYSAYCSGWFGNGGYYCRRNSGANYMARIAYPDPFGTGKQYVGGTNLYPIFQVEEWTVANNSGGTLVVTGFVNRVSE